MARYINAERLKDSMFAYYDCLEESANGRPYKGDTLMDYEVVDMIEDCVESAPPADVVEMVMCKDCVYWQDNNDGYPHEECRWGKDETPDAYDFCSRGERRTDDGNL